MTGFINLLPWRRRRRLLRLRTWSLTIVGCLLLPPLLLANRIEAIVWQQAQQRVKAHSISQLQLVYQHRYETLRDLQQRQQREQQRRTQRQTISEWAPRFIQLAEGLPASVWLSSLSFRNGQVLLNGSAADHLDIQRLEASLRLISGIDAVQIGAMNRQASGQLRFVATFRLLETDNVS